MRLVFSVTITIVLASVTLAQDAKPPAQLPPPGTWVTYQVVRPETPNPNLDMFYTIRLLEAEQRDGETCRWIEFDWSIATPENHQRIVNRYLIPTKALLESRHPYRHLKAAFHGSLEQKGRNPDQTKRQLELSEAQDFTKESLKSRDDDGWELLLFPGLQRECEEVVAKAKIGYQRGTLSCEKVLTGQHIVVVRDNLIGQNVQRIEEHTTIRITHHPDVPFGVAGAVFEFKEVGFVANGKELASGKSQPDVHWLLHDFGTGAKSAFKLQTPEGPSGK